MAYVTSGAVCALLACGAALSQEAIPTGSARSGRTTPHSIERGRYTPDSLDLRWHGDSVGRWVDDYTFVVDSTGFNERNWNDPNGHPGSTNAHMEERYHRVDRDTLEVTVTFDGPKANTESSVEMNVVLHRDPDRNFEEQLCVASKALEYLPTFRPSTQPTQ